MLTPEFDFKVKPNTIEPVDDLQQKIMNVMNTVVTVPDGWEGKNLIFTVRFSDDDEIKDLNFRFRNKHQTTNVLSFPAGDDMPTIPDGNEEIYEKYIGDIIISCDTLEKEAKEQNKTVDDHLTHLLIHSILHLYGYDHIEDDEAEVMEALEISILAELDINDPYHK